MNVRIVVALCAGLWAGAAAAQDAAAPETGPLGPVIPEVVSPEPIAPGMEAPDLPPDPSTGADPSGGAADPAPALPQDDGVEATEAQEGDAAAPPAAAAMMAEEDLQAFIRGRTYQGLDPATQDVVATVSYGIDGHSELTLPDGTQESGTYRFDGDAYCTRYAAFRDGTENCFTLEALGDGRAQAWYTDGRRALILAPAT